MVVKGVARVVFKFPLSLAESACAAFILHLLFHGYSLHLPATIDLLRGVVVARPAARGGDS